MRKESIVIFFFEYYDLSYVKCFIAFLGVLREFLL